MSYGLVKTYEYEDVNENGEVVKKTLRMLFNNYTFIAYYNYLGTDLTADMAKAGILAKKLGITEDTVIGDIESIDLEQQEKLSQIAGASNEFYRNVVAAMVISARRTEHLDFEEVLADLPYEMFNDEKFMNDIQELLLFGIKKN